MQARDYQLLAVNSIKHNQRNLIVIPMRGGKSFLVKLAIETHDWQKVLIITGFRKIVLQFESYFPNDSTYVLASKDYNHEARVTLASFQTYNRRDVDTSQFDLIVVDEYHSRMSKSVEDFLQKSTGTVILLTGTPLTQSNRYITKGIDNVINPINVTQMMERKYLAPTKFMSNRNIIKDNLPELSTSRGDYTEGAVLQVIKKSDLLTDIVQLVDTNKLAELHKTLVYVNFISTAEELYAMLEPLYSNIFILHSKFSDKEQTAILDEYQACEHGLIISIRSLSLGFDSPTSDRLVFALLTKVHSLSLQILWRSATLDPANPHKQNVVYDMLGQLSIVNPYTDFKSYSKKLTCRDECAKLTDPLEQYFCLESCKGDGPLAICSGELSSSYADNEFVTDFQVTSGTPCKEAVPLSQMEYKTTEAGIGKLYKWSKCGSCGCITRYTVTTCVSPSDMIEVYEAEPTTTKNTITILYSRAHKKAIALLDAPDNPTYKVTFFSSSEEMYESAIKYFNNKPFQIISNIAMPKLANVHVDRGLDAALSLVSWDSGSTSGFIKRLIKMKMEHICEHFAIKSGWVYYQMKGITKQVEKPTMNFLIQSDLQRADFLKYFKKLNKDN
jgi:hypothetical protein